MKKSVIQNIIKKQRKILNLVGKNYLDESLKNYFHTELIFISSNIEEIKLSRKQAAEIVAQYPNFKPIPKDNKELLQAKGQKIALEFIEDFSKKKDPIDIYLIKNLHRMVMGEVWSQVAGEYRQENLEFKKSSFIPPHYSRIPQEMYFYDQWLAETQKNLKEDDLGAILECATRAHYELVRIHPFRDGNGRGARVLLNLILRRYGLPYVLLPKTEAQKKMLEALQAANKGDIRKLLELNIGLLDQSFDIVLDYWQKKKLPEK